MPSADSHSAASPKLSAGRRAPWRWLIAIFLVVLFFPVLLWLPWQAQRVESTERQEQLIADTLWVEQTIRFQLDRNEDSLQLVADEIASGKIKPGQFRTRLAPLLNNSREMARIDWFDARGRLLASTNPNASQETSSIQLWPFEQRERQSGTYSLSGAQQGSTAALLYHAPIRVGRATAGQIVASYTPSVLLDEMVPWWFAQDNEIVLSDSDEHLLARRSAAGPGHNVYSHSRQLDLPGASLALRTNSLKDAPKLVPNLLVAAVITLSIGLLFSLWALWRDINRRIAAELALRRQIAFRTAMENSLRTGMRARDLEGRVTYVNPAFCQMVGIPAEGLVGMVPPMPYWAPEAMEDYQRRFSQVLSGKVAPQHETIFQRANGERFPVLIFESPLVDESGKQTGWMGSLLDISERRHAEDLNRAQQEKLQASARLATIGEMASALAHELNQPLAAISSYTTGALNLLADCDAHRDAAGGSVGSSLTTKQLDHRQLQQALEKASAQAQRAGQIIRSVHTFVKKREAQREVLAVADLIDAVAPLIDLQARPFFVSLHTVIAPDLPPVLADRVLLEQVLLNLTRNGIEAMRNTPPERRILRILLALDHVNGAECVRISVIDQGHGIAADVAERLFSPFFSTKAEGMGMGLNICRTAIEFHGGSLHHQDNPGGGTIFQFYLPALAKS